MMIVERASAALVNGSGIKAGSESVSEKPSLDESKFRSMSDRTIGTLLSINFDALTDPQTNYEYITRDSLYQAAHSNEPYGLDDFTKSAVKELLRRPALLERLDIAQDGKLDNKIDLTSVNRVAHSMEQGSPRSKSDNDLGRQLLAGFEKFADPNEKGFITTSSLRQAANGVEGFTAEDSLLAAEVLRRGPMLDGLDADRNGKLDNKIDRENIQIFTGVGSGNNFKAMSDDDITLKFIAVFDRFLGPNGGDSISYEKLNNIANSKAGGSFSAEDSEFARELLDRKSLVDTFKAFTNGDMTSTRALEAFVRKNIHHYGADYNVGPTYEGMGQRVAYDKDGRELARYDYVPRQSGFGGRWEVNLPKPGSMS